MKQSSRSHLSKKKKVRNLYEMTKMTIFPVLGERKRLTDQNRIFQTPVSVILPSVEWAISSENAPSVNN